MNDAFCSPDRTEWGYHRGFPLRSVAWGYREEFRRLLDSLHGKGILDEQARPAADVCGPFLDCELPAGHDHVLKEFLTALDGAAGSLMRVPHIFDDWRRLGLELTSRRVYLGRRYFELWAEGGLPTVPAEARRILDWTSELLKHSPDLACAFLEGWPRLGQRLAPEDLPDFVAAGIEVFSRKPKSGCAWFRLELQSADVYAERIGRTARLERMKGRLTRLFRAVSGQHCEIEPLSLLDADDLMDRGTRVVCGAGHLWLPNSVSDCGSRSANEGYYLLTVLIAAISVARRGFAALHGEQRASRLAEAWAIAHPDAPTDGAFLCDVAEKLRVRRALAQECPGASGLLAHVASLEPSVARPRSVGQQLVACALGQVFPDEVAPALAEVIEDLELAVVAESWATMADIVADVRILHANLQLPHVSETLAFWPDAEFPLTVSEAPPVEAVDASSMKPARPDEAASQAERDTVAPDQEEAAEGDEVPEGDSESGGLPAVYLYDEWNGLENEYFRNWCRLTEVKPTAARSPVGESVEFRSQVERVKRMFQRLRPDVVTREKYLMQGDVIDIDSLVRFITMRRARNAPQARFWVRPRQTRRDLAVALLLDVSGSTGRDAGAENVIQVEKEAAHMLAAGLGELGDRFGIYGFTGNGREQCRFYVYKELNDQWDDAARRRLASAHPGSATRMGVALRHAGRKLASTEARTRLIMVITDGRPMDSGYDPGNHYAHHDVRRACDENREVGVQTFCIALGDEQPTELDLMFPARRYLTLSDVGDLPYALANSYVRLTRD